MWVKASMWCMCVFNLPCSKVVFEVVVPWAVFPSHQNVGKCVGKRQ